MLFISVFSFAAPEAVKDGGDLLRDDHTGRLFPLVVVRLAAALCVPGQGGDCADHKGSTVSFGKSEFRENLRSDKGTFSQEYFVYCKKK